MATPLDNTGDQRSNLSTPLNLTAFELPFPSNRSRPEDTTPASNGMDILCDGARYGQNPPLADCEGARSYIEYDPEQKTYGERHAGLPDGTFPLPYIIMGDKAECYFEVINVGNGATARASLNQISRAANALLMQCGSNVPSQGGIARNIGGDNNLAVTMAIFEPKVQCRGHFADPKSCGDPLSEMPASKDMEVFGPEDQSFVKEILPQIIVSGDQRCLVRLFTTGKTDVAAWYDIWKATEATMAKCGRFFEGGSYRGLGIQGNIFLTVGGLPPRLTTNLSLGV